MKARERLSVDWKSILSLAAVWLTSVLFIASGQFADPDLWGRLSIAALIFQNGRFPYHDVFSYTASHARWIDHEWLSGMAFYTILAHLGEPAFFLGDVKRFLYFVCRQKLYYPVKD